MLNQPFVRKCTSLPYTYRVHTLGNTLIIRMRTERSHDDPTHTQSDETQGCGDADQHGNEYFHQKLLVFNLSSPPKFLGYEADLRG